MEYARLGRSNLEVSRICLGTMHFGTRTPEAEAFAIMDKALEMGINFFDTANVYGRPKTGQTEEIIGRWMAQGGGRRDRRGHLSLQDPQALRGFSPASADGPYRSLSGAPHRPHDHAGGVLAHLCAA